MEDSRRGSVYKCKGGGGGAAGSEERCLKSVNDVVRRTTDDGRQRPAYLISSPYEPSAQVS